MPMAFLLLCMRNVHSRPVAVSRRNKSHWGAAAESSMGRAVLGSAPEGNNDHKLQPKAVRKLG